MGRLFAISDIHGCLETFQDLVLRQILLTRSDRLVLLGDYIDRGDKSKGVIDFIIDLINTGFNVTPLSGNHEVMLLDAWNNNALMPLWLLNDGMSTLESFGVQSIDNLEKKYIDFLRRLKYYHEVGNFLFVHAGFNDSATDPFSDIHGMIWECHPVYKNPLLRTKTIIHGHRPKKIEFVQNLIDKNSKVIPIDTGCVYETEEGYGYLSALDAGNMKLISVMNRKAG